MRCRWMVAALVFVCLPAAWSQTSQKKRVAVLNFDYGTVRSGVAAIFGTDVDVGTGISDMLVEKLVEGGAYSVVERKALDKVLAEQNFSNSDRADPASAARIGRLLGVDAIIVGSITQFGRDDRQLGLGGFGRAISRWGLGGTSVRSAKAVVAVTARLVNVETGEILAVAIGNGESKRSGTSLLGAGGGGGDGGGAPQPGREPWSDGGGSRGAGSGGSVEHAGAASERPAGLGRAARAGAEAAFQPRAVCSVGVGDHRRRADRGGHAAAALFWHSGGDSGGSRIFGGARRGAACGTGGGAARSS